MDLQDESGTIRCNAWNFESLAEISNPEISDGAIVRIVGEVNHYNGSVGLNFTSVLNIFKDEHEGGKKFIPSYPDELRERVAKEVKEIIEKNTGEYKTFVRYALGLVEGKEDRWEAFITSVAACKHHGNRIGGLLLHTYGMLKISESVKETYLNNVYNESNYGGVNFDRLTAKILLHDYMKTKEYQSFPTISYNDHELHHIYNGVVYIHQINNEMEELANIAIKDIENNRIPGDIEKEALDGLLCAEEIKNLCDGILSHHGKWGPEEPVTIEDQLLHLIDMLDSRIVGDIEDEIF